MRFFPRLAARAGALLISSLFCSICIAQSTGSLPSNWQSDSGIHPFGTYDGVQDSVSVESGNLSFCIPLVSLPGLINHNLTIPLCYNSQYQEASLATGTSEIFPVVSWFPWVWGSKTPVMGPGWTLTGRPGVYTAPESGQVIFMPDGGKYTLPSTQSNGQPLNLGPDWNGGNLYLSGNGWLYQKNGTRTTASVSTTTQEFDSYGSLITYTPTSVTDTIGRTVAVSATAASGGTPASMAFQYPDSNGVTRTVTVQFATITSTCTSSQYGIGGPYSMPSAILLPNGLTYTFQYDACGNLIKVTYPSGGYTRYSYALETVGQWGIAAAASETPNWWPYQQNEVVAKSVCPAPSVTMGATSTSAGNTCSVPEETTTYAPTETFPSTGNSGNTVTDPLGNYVVYQFTQANPTWFVPSLESSRSYYNKAGQFLKGVQTTYNGINSDSPMPTLPLTQTTVLDNGQGSQIQYTYDLRPLNTADSPLLEKQEYDFNGSLLRTTKYDWLQLDNPTVYGWPTSSGTGAHILDRKTSETIFNGAGQQVSQTAYQYDNNDPITPSLGFLTKTIRCCDVNGNSAVTTNVWGASGGITQTTDPNGNVTQYSYTDNYADGINRNSGAYPTTITYTNTNGVSHVEHKQYYFGSGLVAASCGENFTGTCKTGLSSGADYTSYTYDLMGRKVSTTTGDGGSTTTCFSEVAGGNCATGTYPLSVTTSEAIASGVTKTTTTELDGEAKVTQTQLNTDPSCSSGSLVVTTYDADERVSTKSNPYCSTSDPTYGVTTYAYDGLSRVTQVTNPDNTATTNTYTGRAVLSTDEGNGAVTVEHISQKDALGRLTAVCEVSGTTQQGSSNNTPSSCGLDVSRSGFLTNYSYDPLGNLLSVAQGGVSRSFSYDAFSRVLSATNPESGTTTYAYDLDNNLLTKKSALGITTTYTYDALNRLTGKSYSDGATPAACFQYDQGTNGIGRLSTEWTQAGTCSATPPTSGLLTERKVAAYDLMGRIATDEQCATPGNCTGTTNTVNYAYNLAGENTSFTNGLTGTSAMMFSNTYDSAGRLSTMAGPTAAGSSSEPTNLFTANNYNATGAIVNAQFGTGIGLQRAYNKRLLPIGETDSTATTPGTATIQITGSEQTSGVSTATITFTGTEQSMVSNGETVYDGGLFIVSINGTITNGGSQYQIEYNQNSTPSTIATTVAEQLSCSFGPVKAVAVGGTVTLSSCTSGTGTDYAISAVADGHSSLFANYSFAVTTSGATMVVPGATFANGTILIDPTGDTGISVLEIFFKSETAPANIGAFSTSTAASVASTLAAAVPSCSASGGYFSAAANGPVITLTSCTAGFGGNAPLQVNGGGEPGSFTMTPSGSTLTGGIDSTGVYDSGTVNLTVNGVLIASAPYGAGSTPTSIATALVASGSSNSLVTLSSSDANLTMTAKDDGTVTDYTYQLSTAYNTASFTQPSFSASSTSGDLEGGSGVPLYSWAINSYAPDGDVLTVTDSVMGTWSYGYDDMSRLVSGNQSSGIHLSWSYDRYGNRWTQAATGSGSAVQTRTLRSAATTTGSTNTVPTTMRMGICTAMASTPMAMMRRTGS